VLVAMASTDPGVLLRSRADRHRYGSPADLLSLTR